MNFLDHQLLWSVLSPSLIVLDLGMGILKILISARNTSISCYFYFVKGFVEGFRCFAVQITRDPSRQFTDLKFILCQLEKIFSNYFKCSVGVQLKRNSRELSVVDVGSLRFGIGLERPWSWFFPIRQGCSRAVALRLENSLAWGRFVLVTLVSTLFWAFYAH